LGRYRRREPLPHRTEQSLAVVHEAGDGLGHRFHRGACLCLQLIGAVDLDCWSVANDWANGGTSALFLGNAPQGRTPLSLIPGA
jgi:hypothetical protein